MSSTLARLLKTLAILAVLFSAVLGAPATLKKGKGHKHPEFKIELGPKPEYCKTRSFTPLSGYIDFSEYCLPHGWGNCCLVIEAGAAWDHNIDKKDWRHLEEVMRTQSARPQVKHTEKGIWEAKAINGDDEEDEKRYVTEDVLDHWVSAFKGMKKEKNNKGLYNLIFYRGNETVGYDNFEIKRKRDKRPTENEYKEDVRRLVAGTL